MSNQDLEANNINVFRLTKLSYMRCNEYEKNRYNELPTPRIDVRECCILLMQGSNDTMMYALQHGHFDCLKHGHKMGMKLPYWSCLHAAGNGRIGILKYAHEHGCFFGLSNICKEAAIYGNVDCLKYAHLNGGLMSENVTKYAVRYGNLDCLKYALQNGCEWRSNMCALSAYSGNLNFVKYCQENGCPWVVKSSLDWFLVGSQVVSLQLRRERYPVKHLINRIKCCINYIQNTADVWENCKFEDNVVVKKITV